MFNHVRRFGLLVALSALLLTVLAACGGASGSTPEARIEGLMTDMNSAFSDANIKDAAKQEEWADKLSKYFIPSEQAAQTATGPGNLQAHLFNALHALNAHAIELRYGRMAE